MSFTEKTQAYIVGKYYEKLWEKKGEQGKAVFVHAVKHYAMQRGSRMAQRVLRDGGKLDYASFCRYGEWAPSREMLDAGTACVKQVVRNLPDYEYHITRCPWHQQFQEMGQSEAGRLYCGCLDEAILRGFNDEIPFHTAATLHESDQCVFVVKDAQMPPEGSLTPRKGAVRDFAYHCAHTYYSFAEMIESVLGEEGKEIVKTVFCDFRKTWGQEMADQIESYQTENFNIY